AQASQIPAHSGLSGAQTADALLHDGRVPGVRIEPTQGMLSDHYEPGAKVLRLSPEVYAGRSLAALGIAAHETGHAYQDAQHYPLLVVRNAIVPLAGLGSSLSWIIIFAGLLLSSLEPALGRLVVPTGIAAFSLAVVFQ